MRSLVAAGFGLMTLVALCAAHSVVATANEGREFLVVVNANNRFSADETSMKAQLRRLYLKQQRTWPNAEECLPIGRPDESAAHDAWLQFLDMTEEQLSEHWLTLKQTTGDTPPESVTSVRSLLRQIARNKGAFSIIEDAEARKLPAKVRVLFRLDLMLDEQSMQLDDAGETQ